MVHGGHSDQKGDAEVIHEIEDDCGNQSWRWCHERADTFGVEPLGHYEEPDYVNCEHRHYRREVGNDECLHGPILDKQNVMLNPLAADEESAFRCVIRLTQVLSCLLYT